MLKWRSPNLLISSSIVAPKGWLLAKVEIVVPGSILFLLKGDLFAKVEIVVYMAHNIQLKELMLECSGTPTLAYKEIYFGFTRYD